MGRICGNCAQPLSDGAKFCRRCGAEQKPDNRPGICASCGGDIPASAAFCRHCGARANATAPAPDRAGQVAAPPIAKPARTQDRAQNAVNVPPRAKPARTQDLEPRAKPTPRHGKPRKRRFGVIAAVAALLVLVVAVSAIVRFRQPGNPPGTVSASGVTSSASAALAAVSLSDISISAADLNIPGLSAMVSPDQPEVSLNDATVDFGLCNLPGEAKLTVKKLAPKQDAKNGFSIQPYDFSLEGRSEFHVPVLLEMAYAPSVEDDAAESNGIFVQHYDGGKWQLVPSWVNADKNTVTVLTNHFSTFAVFEDTSAKDGVVSLFRYQGRYRGPTTPVYTTGNAIDRSMAFVDESIFQQFIDTRAVPVRDATASMLDVLNQSTSGANYYFLATSQEAYESLSPALGKAGMLFVFSKIAGQWYNGVTAEDIILDNAFNIAEIALSASATALAAPELTLVAAGVWAVGLGYEAGSAGYQYVKDSDSRYVAYRDYSESGLVFYLPEFGVCASFKEIYDSKYEHYNPEYARARTVHLIGEDGWAEAFSSIQQKYRDDPRKITAALEALLEGYLDAFWALDGNEVLRYLGERPAKGFLSSGTMADNWEWPSETEIAQYKSAYRERMKQFLAPVIKAMSMKALLELREQTYQAVLELWPLLNTEISFEIVDESLPNGKFFPASALSGMHIALSPLSDAAIPAEWVCAERHDRSNAVFTCNLYAYLKAGCPTRLNFWNTQSDSGMLKPAITADFRLNMPTTVISVSGEMEVNGIYTGTSQGRNMITGEKFALYYPSVRVEKRGEGLLIGPCLQNGNYESELQVLCKYNDGTKRYEGSARLETGDQWTELYFAAIVSEEGGRMRAQVAYAQHFSGHSSMEYEYDAIWLSPLTGSPVARQSSGSVEPEETASGGLPVGGFGF